MRFRLVFLSLSLFSLCFWSSPLTSQEPGKAPYAEGQKAPPSLAFGAGPPKKWLWTWEGKTHLSPWIPLGEGGDSLGIWRQQLGGGFLHFASRKLSWGLGINYEHSQYSLGGAGGALASEDRVAVYNLSLNPFIRAQWSPRWSSSLSLIPSVSEAYGAPWGKSFRLSSFLLTQYKVSPKWDLNFGLLGFWIRQEENPLVIPIIGFTWRPNEKWTFNFGGNREGPGMDLTYRWNKSFALVTQVNWQLREYRLSDTAASPQGLLEEMSIPLQIALEWKPGRQWQLRPYVGVNVWSRYDYKDRAGSAIEDLSAKPAPMLGLGVRFAY